MTYPEPPTDESDLWTLPNVWISPHVGGSVGDEVVRMADCAIEEFIALGIGQASSVLGDPRGVGDDGATSGSQIH
ncbi:MAG: hypothetical protein CL879_00285 [Dehalococcoidia bacterium]|nr:hypothetical protein [Dehalococcoidia bacterium]